ncbi:MAG: sulfatase-like hydrolase/transferase [Paludibacteraceae bacterium]|nr:sulfatase-like hydrolase/transferase [Paludibacteraceae bacterium]
MKNNRREILHYVKGNWALLLFAIIILFTPFFFAFSAANVDAMYRICINAVYAIIVYIILLIVQGKMRKWVMTFIVLLSFVPNVIVLSFLLMDNTIMKSTDFFVVFNTNSAEASGLFSSMPSNVLIWGLIYVSLIILVSLLCRWTSKKCEMPIWIQIVSLAFLLSISLTLPFRTKVPMIDFYKSFYKYNKEKIEVQQFYESRKNLKLNVENLLPDLKKTFVIVIGESQNRQHMQLYGYGRETNPLLTEIQNELAIYADVCSPAVQTLPVLKQVLTFSNYQHPEMYKKEASIIEILKSAGYKTYWLDNQGGAKNKAWAIDSYTPTSYRTIASMSDVFVVEEGGKKDSVLFGYLDETLDDSALNKVIFLHILGNHFDYNTRYEQSFEIFRDTIGVESPYISQLSTSHIENLNAYDNATRYNDYIVRTFIEKLRKQDGMSALMYFSDHGEEVYDYYARSGRSFETISPAMCEIPLILWMNEMYKQEQTLTINEQLPICIDDIIYAMMDMTGVRYALYDSCQSFFTEKYTPKVRVVAGEKYDEIVTRSKDVVR